MPNVALQNYFYELAKNYEDRHETRLDEAGLVTEFGPEAGRMIEGFLEGRDVVVDRKNKILSAVELLEGDTQDASSALALSAADKPAHERTEEESIILNDRLMTRMQNLERFVRRIGQLDDFHAWLKSERERGDGKAG